METKTSATLRISNIPQTTTVKHIFDFLETTIGKGTIYACDIFSDHKGWKQKGHGRVQFETLEAKDLALTLSMQNKLKFGRYLLTLSPSFDDIVIRPSDPNNRIDCSILHTGVLVKSDCMSVLESWEDVKTWVMPEKDSLLAMFDCNGEVYKLEIQFGDILETCLCSLDGDKPNAVLLKLKHAPKIYQKVSGKNVASRFKPDRYHICKENLDFIWARTTDFSPLKSIGYSSSLCWEFGENISSLDTFTNLPFYTIIPELTLEKGEDFDSSFDLVPLITHNLNFKLSYEVLFQLNSLIHTHKISLTSINNDLLEILSKTDIDKSISILQKMHKLPSTCYNPLSYIKTRLHVTQNSKNPPSLSYNKLMNNNVMSCHRIYITPTKIYCLGPELESSNYIVKNFGEYASDFLRVTFVEEDWGRLSVNSVSTTIERGFGSNPVRTSIYDRILSILRNGILIGEKKFEFLAFSASQLRSNSVWMFASNEKVKAEDVRKWMGCFNKIRSVSKCAARMGQLFSSSSQTIEVLPHHVDVIPDIEIITEGVPYCFSDGIGKISQAFAKIIAQKMGLNFTPSAFQIRYGGYKGVIAIDRNSYKKLSLRSSMLKFESENRMLNVTKYSKAMPCYLNREIIILLSTLGISDEIFVNMQENQLKLVNQMLVNKESALQVLASVGLNEYKSILVKMLLQGYEPSKEPYLNMMLHSYYENQIWDLRSRSRVVVPKGRVLLGCLDETGVLNYGQVYARISLGKNELCMKERGYFVISEDGKTGVIKGKVVVTKNPCLHPGDVRVLEAVYDVALDDKGLVDCIVFPQKGERPHPNECSGGDLDGDQYFISWDEGLIPDRTVDPMDYTGRRPHIKDHDVTLLEIQKFFVDYLINDTLGAISTAHLVHADREPDKALNEKCLHLANLHSMAVDFAKTGAPAEIPTLLKPREFPDFMQRFDRPMYTSQGALGKLYRATILQHVSQKPHFVFSEKMVEEAYDHDLVVDGYEVFVKLAERHKEMYLDKMGSLLNYYGAESEDEILSGNIRKKSTYLQRDNRRYFELKDRILVGVKSLEKEAKGWFESSCEGKDRQKMASAWYYVTYHSSYCHGSVNCLGFPWIVGDILLDIKAKGLASKMS